MASVIKWLINEGGADVNIQDEYSSSRRKAKQLNVSPYQSK